MKNFLLAIFAVAGVHFNNALAVEPTTLDNSHYNDGPYISYDADTLQSYNIENGKLVKASYSGPLSIPNTFTAAKVDHYQGVKKIAAISDIHGQFEIFKTLLVNNQVIDEQLNWRFGEGHLVITGDIFDRGDTVTEALWLVYKLEQQALQAGGKVHYLLGNHEYMVLRNDQRYLHPKYVYTLSFFNHDLRELLSNDTVLGRWLRSKSTIISINDFVFLHGGIHKELFDLKLSLEQINAEFRQTIGMSKKALKEQPLWAFLYGKKGPIWYRGFFRDEALTSDDVAYVLAQLNAKKIIVGHTSMPALETRHNEQIIAIDSSIKKGVSGEILLWHDDSFWRGKMQGDTTKLFSQSH